MTASSNIAITVNGVKRDIAVSPLATLLTVLRDDLALTGAKRGCNQGVCGACTVLIDGRPVRACLSVAANCTEQEITTIEGISVNGQLAPMQQAMINTGAVQCGFCTAGIVLSAHAFLAANPSASKDEIREALSGNLCRCSGYKKIIDAALLVATQSNAPPMSSSSNTGDETP